MIYKIINGQKILIADVSQQSDWECNDSEDITYIKNRHLIPPFIDYTSEPELITTTGTIFVTSDLVYTIDRPGWYSVRMTARNNTSDWINHLYLGIILTDEDPPIWNGGSSGRDNYRNWLSNNVRWIYNSFEENREDRSGKVFDLSKITPPILFTGNEKIIVSTTNLTKDDRILCRKELIKYQDKILRRDDYE